MLLSRFILNDTLKLDGGLISGPWSYRIIYIIIIPPTYSGMLILIGTLFGKHEYFRHRVLNMWSHIIGFTRHTKPR